MVNYWYTNKTLSLTQFTYRVLKVFLGVLVDGGWGVEQVLHEGVICGHVDRDLVVNGYKYQTRCEIACVMIIHVLYYYTIYITQ